MENYNTIVLHYNFKTDKHEYIFTECFKPYSGKEILSNQYFINNYKDAGSLISDSENYDIKSYIGNKLVENALISNIESSFSNMVLDTIFTLYFCFLHRDDFIYYKGKRIPFFPWNFIYYIGIYTELIKNKINELKIDISIVLNLLDNKTISSDEKNKLIQIIFSKYSVSVDINNNNSVRNGLLQMLSSFSLNKSTACEIGIDFFIFDDFIKLLETFDRKKYIYKNPCFCLAHENTEYYFSLSGDKKEPEKQFFDKIRENIIEIVKKEFNQPITVNYCRISDKTLSYGRKDENRKFISFSSMGIKSPISYGEYDEAIYIEKKIDSFTCCERKLFSGMNLNGSIDLYCKYEPCVRCIPSINDNKKKYSDFKFYAFAKNPEACKEMILNHQKQILSTKFYDFYRYI